MEAWHRKPGYETQVRENAVSGWEVLNDGTRNGAQPLTANSDVSEPCSSSLSQHGTMDVKQGKFCCDRCSLDGYVLHHSKAMLDEVGLVAFNAILQGTR